MKRSTHEIVKFFTLFLFCSFFLIQCNKIVNEPKAVNEPVPVLFKLTIVNPPSTVHSIVGLLERSGYDPIQQTFTITGDTATGDFGQVIAGTWHLSVTAYDSNQTALYFGETDVTVLAGQLNIVNLNMNPLTGELVVVVSWGDNSLPKDKIVFYANDRSGTSHVLTMNLDGSDLTSIVQNAYYPFWFNNKSQIIFQTNSFNLGMCNSDGSNLTALNSLPYHSNHVLYSESLEKILCYYFDNGVRNLGMTNMDGSNFEIISNRYFDEILPQTTRNSNWVYYLNDSLGTNDLYRMLPDGSNDQAFIISPYNIGSFAFSYDNSQLIYSITNSSVSQLVVYDMQTGVRNTIDFSGIGEVNWPSFTKDGQNILYAISTDNAPTFNTSYERAIFIMDTNGNNRTRLTPGLDYVEHVRPLYW